MSIANTFARCRTCGGVAPVIETALSMDERNVSRMNPEGKVRVVSFHHRPDTGKLCETNGAAGARADNVAEGLPVVRVTGHTAASVEVAARAFNRGEGIIRCRCGWATARRHATRTTLRALHRQHVEDVALAELDKLAARAGVSS